LVELVSFVEGRVVPERCLTCAEIPDSFLPSEDLRVGPSPLKAPSYPDRQGRGRTPRSRKWDTSIDAAGHRSRFPIGCSRPLRQAG
jgi:hypothetical protein